MKNIEIKSNIKDYRVIFNNDLKNLIESLIEKYETHFIVDENIWKLYERCFKKTKLAKSVYVFKAVEKNKTLKMVNTYVEYLLSHDIQKNHKVVVIGGGLVQDMGSFTSHIIKRGIDWIFIPTTLLSMVDSCIGSKSGINIGKYKNQVGSFHPPIEIYIDINFLKTLPRRDMINGIGEMVKHVLIKGEKPYEELLKNIRDINEKMIYDSLLIKKEIVEEDELEKGRRKLLNYGHTFGHALEGYTNNKIPHGLGVLIGMDMANYFSLKRGMLKKETFDTLHLEIGKLVGKNVLIGDIKKYIEFLKMDKKVVGDSVDAILCKDIGNICIERVKFDKELIKNISDYLDFINDKSK